MPLFDNAQSDLDKEPQRPAPGEWTPARGLLKGTIACLMAAVVPGVGWCAAAWHVPEATVVHLHEDAKVMLFLVVIGALVGFASAWILFAVMHRFSQMVGGLCPVSVVVVVILIVLAKQIVLATHGVKLPSGSVIGWSWLEPVTVLKSNLGTWMGIAAAVYLFKDGASLTELF